MEQYCPDLCQLFTNLSDGSLPTFKAKESLETLLGDRLWTNQCSFWKFRQHQFEDVIEAFRLYRIRPPSSCLAADDLLPVGGDNNFSVFTSKLMVTDICRTLNCKSNGIRNSSNEELDNLLLPVYLAKEGRECQLEKCILATRSPGRCQTCLNNMISEIDLFSGALVIPIHVFVVQGKKSATFTPLESIPEQLQLGDTAYTLSACIYGEGSHFVSIVRDFSTDRLFFCDGMTNNAQFVEYKATTGTFPVKISRKSIQMAYFIRSEYTNKKRYY